LAASQGQNEQLRAPEANEEKKKQATNTNHNTKEDGERHE
jgi:hypothetical protein